MKKLNQKKNKPSIQALKEEDACRVSAKCQAANSSQLKPAGSWCKACLRIRRNPDREGEREKRERERERERETERVHA